MNESSPRLRELLRGVAHVAPLLLGAAPFGLIFGVTVNTVHMQPVAAQATSTLIFAGSAQLVFARLFGDGAPWLTLVLTGILLNLRHMLYSASIAPYMQRFSRGWKWLLAYLLTDEAYAVVIGHFDALGAQAPLEKLSKQWYFLGAGLALWLIWHVSTAIGIFVGGRIPESWSLDFAVPLTFTAIVLPNLRDRAAIGAALTAGLLSVLAFDMPFKLSLVVATLAGIAVGMALDRRVRP
jgi:4-azaleucine resistance transporter AzlC